MIVQNKNADKMAPPKIQMKNNYYYYSEMMKTMKRKEEKKKNKSLWRLLKNTLILPQNKHRQCCASKKLYAKFTKEKITLIKETKTPERWNQKW